MKKSSVLLNAGRLSVAAVLIVGCIAGDALAQQQMRRMPETGPAAPPPPANTVARVAPAAPPATPMVADWARGAQQNFGLVLMTDDKGIGGFSNNGCLTDYTSDIKLEVQSY
jgi:hypothetical protein